MLNVLHDAPDFWIGIFIDLLRVLPYNSIVSEDPLAAKALKPLFMFLTSPNFGSDGQHRTLQVTVNVLELQGSADHQASKLPVPLLDSPVSYVQQLVDKFLLHMLMKDHFHGHP